MHSCTKNRLIYWPDWITWFPKPKNIHKGINYNRFSSLTTWMRRWVCFNLFLSGILSLQPSCFYVLFSIFPSYIIYMLALTVTYLQLRPLPASTAFPPAVIWPPEPTSPILIVIVIFIVPSGHAARPSPSPGRRRALPLDVRRVCWIVNSVFLQSSFEFLQSVKAVIEW